MTFLMRSFAVAAIGAVAVLPLSAQAADAVAPRIVAPLHVDIDRFMQVGEAEFAAGAASSQTVEGWADQGFGTIVLMPENGVALCEGLTIRYGSGEEEAYPLVPPGLLNELQIYEIAVHGDPADIAAIDANCRAAGPESVTIGFYGMPGEVFPPVANTGAHAPANSGPQDPEAD